MPKKLPTPQIGQRFGGLIYVGPHAHATAGYRLAVFRCDCGNTTAKRMNRVIRGASQYCGRSCRFVGRRVSASKVQHGFCLTRNTLERKAYNAWCHMKSRCYNPKFKLFRYYGGRGISVCDEWLNDPQAFVSHIGLPSGFGYKATVDRIDNNGNYEPGNVRWSTSHQQARNTRRNHFVTVFGETMCLSACAERYGMLGQTLKQRLVRSKWSIEKAVTTPVLTPRNRK